MSAFFLAAAAILSQESQLSSNEVSDWQWDEETPICRLRQENSSGETIELGRTPANDETELRIALPAAQNIRAGHYDVAVLTTDSEARSVGDILIARHEGKLRVHAVTPDATFIERLSNASTLEISHERVGPIRISIRSATAATAALGACQDRKMRAWGIDPTAWRALKSRPFPLKPVRDRFSALNYPRDALAQGIEADAIIRLDVATDGSVQHCRGLNPGGYKGFEVSSCAVLKGAKFRPAVDSAGNPVSAPYLLDVVFRIDH